MLNLPLITDKTIVEKLERILNLPTQGIFELLDKSGKGVGGEIQLTDAISELLKQEQTMPSSSMAPVITTATKPAIWKPTLAAPLSTRTWSTE